MSSLLTSVGTCCNMCRLNKVLYIKVANVLRVVCLTLLDCAGWAGVGESKRTMRGLPVVGRQLKTARFARLSWRSNALSLLLAVASFGALSGCGNVSVTDRTPPNPPQQPRPPLTHETHDLAIAAVDFDPALNSHQLPAGGHYYLLVAVENKGNRRET